MSEWGREDSNLRSLKLKAQSGMATNVRRESAPPTLWNETTTKTSRLRGRFRDTETNGVEAATSGVTGVTRPFQRVSPDRRIG